MTVTVKMKMKLKLSSYQTCLTAEVMNTWIELFQGETRPWFNNEWHCFIFCKAAPHRIGQSRKVAFKYSGSSFSPVCREIT